jgi:hypothetical protein
VREKPASIHFEKHFWTWFLEGGASARSSVVLVEEAKIREHLAQADKNIGNFRLRIAEQRHRIETLSADGHPTDLAEKLLKTYQEMLEVIVKLRKVIITELENYDARHRSYPGRHHNIVPPP